MGGVTTGLRAAQSWGSQGGPYPAGEPKPGPTPAVGAAALPCLAMGPTELGLLVGPCPSLYPAQCLLHLAVLHLAGAGTGLAARPCPTAPNPLTSEGCQPLQSPDNSFSLLGGVQDPFEVPAMHSYML